MNQTNESSNLSVPLPLERSPRINPVAHLWNVVVYNKEFPDTRSMDEELNDLACGCKYAVFGRVYNKAGQVKYLSGFIMLKEATSLYTLRAVHHKSIHFELSKGCLEDNIARCFAADTTPLEYGKYPEGMNLAKLLKNLSKEVFVIE